SEKDMKILNLTLQLVETHKQIENLTNILNKTIDELNYYKEKKYVEEIRNYFYNISNYFTNIQNKFFPIEVSISLISITLSIVIFKLFHINQTFINIGKWIKSKLKKKEKNKNESVNNE
ncbi:MAG: hypothetical protein QXJ28_01255, partial [Candidatus Pacearchaeota archaeon]